MRQIVFGMSFLGLFFWGTHSNAQHSKTAEPKKDTLRYCSGHVFAIVQTNEKSQYHGTTTRFFRNGNASEIETYKNGILNGKSIYFYETGDTSVTIHYTDGIQHGESKAYYQNGKTMFVNQYFAGTMQSECTYFDTSGTPFNGNFKAFSFKTGVGRVVETVCINGKPNENMLIRDEETCNIIHNIPFKNGIIEGRAISYKSNGTINRASFFEKGKYIKEDDSLYSQNIKMYSHFLHFDSSSSAIYNLRALAHMRVIEKSAAIKDLDKVIQLDPKNYKAYYNRGVIVADSLPLKALADFKKCNAIQPDFYFAHHNTGFVHFKQKDYKKAIEGFKKALLYKPEYLPSINYLGLVYEILKDKKKSNYYFELAESIQSNFTK